MAGSVNSRSDSSVRVDTRTRTDTTTGSQTSRDGSSAVGVTQRQRSGSNNQVQQQNTSTSSSGGSQGDVVSGSSLVDRIAQEELARAAEERRRARESEEKRKRDEAERRSNSSNRIDTIASQEVARAAGLRSANRAARQAGAERLDQIASEEYSDALAAAAKRNAAADAAEAAANAEAEASNARLDQLADNTLRDLLADIEAQQRDNEARRAEAARRRAASNRRIDSRTDQAMRELMADQRRAEAERDRNASSAERTAERSAQRNVDIEDQIILDIMRELQRQGENDRAIEKFIDDVAEQELSLASLNRLLRRIREAGLGMQDREPVTRETMDERLPIIISPSEIASRIPQVPTMSTSDFAKGYVNSVNEMLEDEASKQGIHTESRDYVRQVTGVEPPGFAEDILFERGYDVTGKKRKKWEKIVDRTERKRTKSAYSEAEIKFDPGEEESSFMEKVRNNANRMIRRFLNPSLVHIAGERLETHTEKVNGQVRTFARRVYSDRVTNAIEAVRDVYDCSISDVLRLLQLRAGLGVAYDGTIAGVNPNEFRLTEDQAVELLNDIVESQRVNGHPLGPVDGMPAGNNVRDDTGRFVVVAGTRCFPLGYMPKSLIGSLSRNWGSALHGLTERQIQKMIGEQWINDTYPQLCANTSGNSMYQARAIEYMMRAMMAIDGMNPNDLNIPDIVENKMLIQMRTEQQVTEDGHIAEANKVKHDQEQAEVEELRNRHMKTSQVRNRETGEIESVSTRRFHGDSFKTISSLERSAKAANIMIEVSSVPEEAVAKAEMNVANAISDGLFNGAHSDIAANYEMTAGLLNASRSKEAEEALTVAEALYRIDGHLALDAFINEMEDGKYVNRFTNADLRAFLARMGVTNGNVSEEGKKLFGLVSNGDVRGFLSNVQAALDGAMLGSGMFRKGESERFVKMGMSEFARSSLRGRESYTNSQVEQWVNHGGGEELIRSMLMTDAGREAFMTQGITSLGRKSPVEHLMRRVMSANGVTEFAVRTLFDRFPEYGVNKIMQMVPYSNTLSYLTSRGISSMGDMLALSASEATSPNMVTNVSERLGREMSRVRDYQVGGRLDFFEGLRKNLWYDTVMAGEKALVAGVYAGVILALGGVQPPKDDRDIFTWSEWKIGSGDDAVPIRWAWWMDDLSGIGLPLGMCYVLYNQYGWDGQVETLGVDGPTTRNVKDIAVSMFINSVANFNDGNAVFDMIDFVNNPEEEFAAALDDSGSFDPTRDEKWMSLLERGFWGLIGDLTPTVVGQLVPWSKDFIGRTGKDDAHTAYRVYDTDGRTKSEAEAEYKTEATASYSDAMRRKATQSNILYALWMDWWTGAGSVDSDITGYKYTEQPLDTMVDPYAQAMFDRFYLDLDPATSPIPINDQEAREAALDEAAEDVVQWIDEHYINATQASLDGFVLNYDARVNCINYCHKMINQAWQDYYDELDNGWLEDDAYEQVLQNRQDKIDHYNNLIYNFFQSDEIGWTLPRYKRKESDMETRYVDEQGRPMTYLDTLGEYPEARAERYWYGNTNDILPFISPDTENKGRNYETIPYNIVLDEDGNPVNDVEAMYDNAAAMDAISMGRLTGRDVQELMWGGQGTNLKDDVSEQLAIPRGGVPTLGGAGGAGGGRPWELLDVSVPEASGIGSLTPEQFKKRLGIESSAPVDGKYAAQKAHDEAEAASGGSALDWYNSYGGSGGGYSYSGGSSYEYNPRIYSSPRSVYSGRASGMSTRAPYKATSTYLRPSFYTKGSREAYSRQN